MQTELPQPAQHQGEHVPRLKQCDLHWNVSLWSTYKYATRQESHDHLEGGCSRGGCRYPLNSLVDYWRLMSDHMGTFPEAFYQVGNYLDEVSVRLGNFLRCFSV